MSQAWQTGTARALARTLDLGCRWAGHAVWAVVLVGPTIAGFAALAQAWTESSGLLCGAGIGLILGGTCTNGARLVTHANEPPDPEEGHWYLLRALVSGSVHLGYVAVGGGAVAGVLWAIFLVNGNIAA